LRTANADTALSAAEMLQPMETPRETMRRLPRVLQPFLTWLTGVPLAEQEPLYRWTPWSRGAATITVLAVGLGLGAAAFVAPLWCAVPLVLVSWLLTTGAMRMLYVVIEHVCTHGLFSRSVLGNRIIGDVISTVLWATPFNIFRRDHRLHHSATRMWTDPDVQFIYASGYRRGMTQREFWRYLITTLISPKFHAVYFWQRLKLNFAGSDYRRGMSVVYAIYLAAGLLWSGLWVEWAVLWLVPVSVLFQVSSLINYLSEHRWPEVDAGESLGRAEKARLSFGRFCGDPLPTHGVFAWVVWWLRLLLVHLPYRIFVLVGDLPQHDLHHRQPGSDWANAAFVRRNNAQRALSRADGRRGLGNYTEVWGTVIDHLRASLDRPAKAQVAKSQPPLAEARFGS
jgi:hypothetical protein